MTSEEERLELPARLEDLSRFLEFATEKARQRGFGGRLPVIELVLEEALVNVIRYAATTAGDKVVLQVESDPETLTYTITDHGPAFNPLEAAPPDLESDLLERPVGGLGIHFIRELADDVRWSRKAGENCLQLIFRPQDD